MSDENRARGFKSTLSNPRTSAEAKEHARQELENLTQDYEGTQTQRTSGGDTTSKSRYAEKNEGNVIGGYKATLKNPRVSEEAKEHAQDVLEEHGVDIQ